MLAVYAPQSLFVLNEDRAKERAAIRDEMKRLVETVFGRECVFKSVQDRVINNSERHLLISYPHIHDNLLIGFSLI